MASTETLQLALNLPNRDQAGVEAALADIYNPQSPNYHHWLAPSEIDARFGPTQAQFDQLVSWAEAKGMKVTYKAGNSRILEVQASAAVVNNAFHVTLTKYHDATLNRDFHAPDREPTTDLPFDLLSVDGLEDSQPKIHHLRKGPDADLPVLPATIAAPTFGGGRNALTGLGLATLASTPSPVKPKVAGAGPAGSYLPTDMRAAYYGNGSLTGAGQTVGIFSFDGYLTSDLAVFANNTGFSSTVPVTNRLVSGYAGNCYSSTNGTSGTCDDGEQILDIVQVQGMAPGLSQIYFYEGTSANTILNLMYTDNLTKIFSSSWGGGGFATSSDTYFQNMALAGMSYLSATGDDGAFYKSNYSAPSFDPYITQVGGTDLTTSGPGGTWISETGWPDSGGGFWITGMTTSAKIAIPSWQTAAVNTSNKASATYRNVPDFAAEANYDNPTADNGVFLNGYGGTSYATPRMAGYLALALQQQAANGTTPAGFGFINPTLYTAGEGSSAATIFHDITSGSNPAVNPSTGAVLTTPSYNAVTGYDLVTGWGSPNTTGLINLLAGSPPASFTTPATEAVSVVRGNQVAVNIPVTGLNGYTGTVILAGTSTPLVGWVISSTPGSTTSPVQVLFTVPSSQTQSTYPVTLTLQDSTNSALTTTVTAAITVEKRANGDFAMTTSGVTLTQGTSANAAVTVTPGSGLADSINVTVSGVPSGITAVVVNPTVAPQTTTNVPLAITASSSLLPGTYSVLVTGTNPEGMTHTISLPVTVTGPTNLIVNGSFETGALSPWTSTSTCTDGRPAFFTISSGIPVQDGNYFLLMNGDAAACTQTLSQTINIPAGYGHTTLNFYQDIETNYTDTAVHDTLTVTATMQGVTYTVGQISNLNATTYYWQPVTFDMSAFAGPVTLTITGKQVAATATYFLIDNFTLTQY